MRKNYFIQESLMKKKMHTGVHTYGVWKDLQVCTKRGDVFITLKHHLLREERDSDPWGSEVSHLWQV